MDKDNTTHVPETVSEREIPRDAREGYTECQEAPKPKRGRPRSIARLTSDECGADIFPQKVTSRTRINFAYSGRGGIVLGLTTASGSRDALLEFFMGPPSEHKQRHGALVEIGRIAMKLGDDVALDAARAIYEGYRVSGVRPRTRDIAVALRNWRLENEGRQRSSGERGLFRKLTRLISDHQLLYPEMSNLDVYAILSAVQARLMEEEG